MRRFYQSQKGKQYQSNNYNHNNINYINSNQINYFESTKSKDKIIYNRANKNENIKKGNYLIKGLENDGNNCYIISFLQILFHTPNFINYIKKDDCQDSQLVKLLLDLYNYKSDIECKSFINGIKKVMREVKKEYGTYNPGDSQNFAIDFLDKLISETKNENSLDSINSIYDGNLSKKQKYFNFIEEFNNKNNLIEKLFQFVEVSVGRTNLLDSFSINLHIELNVPTIKTFFMSSWIGNDYSKLDDLLKMKFNNNLKLADLPEILIITLNRGIIGHSLIRTKVNFSDEIDLEPYFDNEINKIMKTETKKYLLYGINERSGENKNQGHYYCYVNINNVWYYFSDKIVCKNISPNYNSSNVFGLYYVRKDLKNK